MPEVKALVGRRADEAGNRPPILLVHGAWHSAQCWDNFIDFFENRGVDVFAVNLRGHGGRPNAKSLRFTRVYEYAADVAHAVIDVTAECGRRPLIVGHSMGGMVVQKYLEDRDDIPGAVLLASVPPGGVWRTTLSILGREPGPFLKANATLSLWPLVATPELTQRHFFSDSMPAEEVRRHFAHLQDESYFAFLDMLALALPKPKRVTTPVTVLGARNDTIFPPAAVARTARAYGVKAEIFENMAHDMMLEAGWRDVAERILQAAAKVTETRPALGRNGEI